MNEPCVDPRSWDGSRAELVDRITSNAAVLKLVVKTKDDPQLLRGWIDHHARIVGEGNLIILDNCSTDPAAADLYRELEDACTVIRFDGFHNRVHRVHEFGELYAALRMSTRFYAFLDTDERLVRFDAAGNLLEPSSLVSTLSEDVHQVVPGVWLENVFGYQDRFWLSLKRDHLGVGLRSGKPIISSSVAVEGMLNHNRQLAPEFYGDAIRTDFFVLHLKRLSATQRIASNMSKLRAYNAFKGANLSLEDVLGLEPDEFPEGNKRNWIREIQALSREDADTTPAKAPLGGGTCELVDGSLRFADQEQRAAFRDFIECPDRWLDVLIART